MGRLAAATDTFAAGRTDREVNRGALGGGFLASLVLGASLSFSALAAVPSTPSQKAPRKAVSYDIPPQPLMLAVEAFAVATGVQVLYDRPTNTQARSPGVRGVLPPETALKRLMEGTEFTARFTDQGDIALEPLQATPSLAGASGAPPPDLPTLTLETLKVEGRPVIEDSGENAIELRLYRYLIQNSIRQALTVNSKTSRGDYWAMLDLWIGPTGTIQRSSMPNSSGDSARDLAIVATLQGLALGQPPPANLPQPIRVGVRSRLP